MIAAIVSTRRWTYHLLTVSKFPLISTGLWLACMHDGKDYPVFASIATYEQPASHNRIITQPTKLHIYTNQFMAIKL
jgi:hypothetical protein